MTDVFVWQEYGRLTVYAIDTIPQLHQLIRRIVGVLRACEELEPADVLEAFLDTQAAQHSQVMCINQIKRTMKFIDVEHDSFQIFAFVKVVRA